MNDFYYFIIAGAVLMIVPLGLIAWLQAGFFGAWFKAKRSRGRRLIVKLVKPVRDDFTTGLIEQGFLVYGPKKAQRRLKLTDDVRIYQAWGVRGIDVHDEKNAPLSPDYTGVGGFDAEAFENLLTRALYRPSLEENKDQLILIAVVIVGLLVLLSLGLVWSVQGQVAALSNVGHVAAVV